MIRLLSEAAPLAVGHAVKKRFFMRGLINLLD